MKNRTHYMSRVFLQKSNPFLWNIPVCLNMCAPPPPPGKEWPIHIPIVPSLGQILTHFFLEFFAFCLLCLGKNTNTNFRKFQKKLTSPFIKFCNKNQRHAVTDTPNGSKLLPLFVAHTYISTFALSFPPPLLHSRATATMNQSPRV